MTEKWMSEERGRGCSSMHGELPSRGNPCWGISRKHVAGALKIAGDSAPGPDGVPFEAWRRLGALGPSMIYEVLRSVMQEGAG